MWAAGCWSKGKGTAGTLAPAGEQGERAVADCWMDHSVEVTCAVLYCTVLYCSRGGPVWKTPVLYTVLYSVHCTVHCAVHCTGRGGVADGACLSSLLTCREESLLSLVPAARQPAPPWRRRRGCSLTRRSWRRTPCSAS